jgi:crotonobetainyl-CoA:carnitine CoA-transferase CaiB-like acyl-CoA transferase
MAPARGQHADEVLRELGKSDAQVAALRASGALV